MARASGRAPGRPGLPAREAVGRLARWWLPPLVAVVVGGFGCTQQELAELETNPELGPDVARPAAVVHDRQEAVVASELLELTNRARADADLAPLEIYWDLADDARLHSARMAAAGRIYHSEPLERVVDDPLWTALGENVGVGPSAPVLQRAFMNSPTHREHVLGDYDYIGVGVAREGRALYVTLLFMKSPRRGLQHALPPFVDDELSPHERAIHALAAAGVTHGCARGPHRRFCPDRPIARGELAAMLARALALRGPATGRDDRHGSEQARRTIAGLLSTMAADPRVDRRDRAHRRTTRGEAAAAIASAFAPQLHPAPPRPTRSVDR